MKKYKPNFNDPRVASKARSALGWATQQLHEHKYAGWSTRHLDKRIGYSHTNLGRYLRQQLLITHNNHYSMEQGFTKQYRLNLHGVYKLAQQLGIEYNPRKLRRSIGVKTAIEQYQPQFQTAFEYTHKNNRSYHPLQNLRSDIRKPLFEHYGYKHNYDIENSYPTLLLNAVHQHCTLRKPLTALEEYVANPQQVRLRLAQQIGVDYLTAKKILIGKCNGGTLRIHSELWRMLDAIPLHRLRRNTWFKQFALDLNRAWSNIARHYGARSFSPSERMSFYLQLEKQVMAIVQTTFERNQIDVFLEHDGWRATAYIDTDVLEQLVKDKLNYTVRFVCK